MPDQDGLLSDEEKAKVVTWFAERRPGLDAVCPMCGSPDWLITNHLVTPIIIGTVGGLKLGGTSYPQIMLISPCGHTLYVNAVVVGVVPGAPTPSEQP